MWIIYGLFYFIFLMQGTGGDPKKQTKFISFPFFFLAYYHFTPFSFHFEFLLL